MFDLYSCKVRIGGSVLNEVPKVGVTAPEVEVLRFIHGSDAVADLKRIGEVKRTDREERARLEGIYASAATSMGDSLVRKKRMFTELFGHVSNALPKTAEAVVAAPSEMEDFEDETAAPAPVARPPKRTPVAKEPAYAE